MRGVGLSNQVRPNFSSVCAPCCRSRTRTRSSTPISSPKHEKRSARQTQARLPSLEQSQLRLAVSSTAYSPTATDGQPNTNRVDGPVPPLTAIAIPAAWSDADGRFGTGSVGVATARLAREWAMRSCVSIPAVLGGCSNITRQAKSRHARLPKTHELLLIRQVLYSVDRVSAAACASVSARSLPGFPV
jgi:hypothetical protein